MSQWTGIEDKNNNYLNRNKQQNGSNILSKVLQKLNVVQTSNSSQSFAQIVAQQQNNYKSLKDQNLINNKQNIGVKQQILSPEYCCQEVIIDGEEEKSRTGAIITPVIKRRKRKIIL